MMVSALLFIISHLISVSRAESVGEMPAFMRPFCPQVIAPVELNDPSREALAKQMIARQKKRIERSLSLINPAFHSYADLKTSIERWLKTQPQWKTKLYSELQDPKNLQIKIRTPDGIRMQIQTEGFKNLYESGSSRGEKLEGNDYLERRKISESAQLGIAREDYDKMDPTLKPKYGYFGFSEKANFRMPLQELQTTQYGEDIWIFEAEKLMDRSTFTLGDSAGAERTYNKPTNVLTLGRLMSPFEQVSLSIAYFSDRVPANFLVDSKKAELQNMQATIKEEADPAMNVFLDRSFEIPGFNFSFTNARYLENQIAGPLSLDDKPTFVFTRHPPEGRFLNDLRSKGIQIRDGRVDPERPKNWLPASAH